ncbi:tripartite motif-containing protein 67 [Platysternon megacephalum]|uniref:Tripartite motif-containing protein 67 n=1 Tax=Platysternon megacephalum TaxID=55544 RepID=A0A4D9ECB7_9SAUR|nr:tripartite motif-containing protein 67 [Platysternon megacephalum]
MLGIQMLELVQKANRQEIVKRSRRPRKVSCKQAEQKLEAEKVKAGGREATLEVAQRAVELENKKHKDRETEAEKERQEKEERQHTLSILDLQKLIPETTGNAHQESHS